MLDWCLSHTLPAMGSSRALLWLFGVVAAAGLGLGAPPTGQVADTADASRWPLSARGSADITSAEYQIRHVRVMSGVGNGTVAHETYEAAYFTVQFANPVLVGPSNRSLCDLAAAEAPGRRATPSLYGERERGPLDPPSRALGLPSPCPGLAAAPHATGSMELRCRSLTLDSLPDGDGLLDTLGHVVPCAGDADPLRDWASLFQCVAPRCGAPYPHRPPHRHRYRSEDVVSRHADPCDRTVRAVALLAYHPSGTESEAAVVLPREEVPSCALHFLDSSRSADRAGAGAEARDATGARLAGTHAPRFLPRIPPFSTVDVVSVRAEDARAAAPGVPSSEGARRALNPNDPSVAGDAEGGGAVPRLQPSPSLLQSAMWQPDEPCHRESMDLASCARHMEDVGRCRAQQRAYMACKKRAVGVEDTDPYAVSSDQEEEAGQAEMRFRACLSAGSGACPGPTVPVPPQLELPPKPKSLIPGPFGPDVSAQAGLVITAVVNGAIGKEIREQSQTWVTKMMKIIPPMLKTTLASGVPPMPDPAAAMKKAMAAMKAKMGAMKAQAAAAKAAAKNKAAAAAAAAELDGMMAQQQMAGAMAGAQAAAQAAAAAGAAATAAAAMAAGDMAKEKGASQAAVAEANKEAQEALGEELDNSAKAEQEAQESAGEVEGKREEALDRAAELAEAKAAVAGGGGDEARVKRLEAESAKADEAVEKAEEKAARKQVEAREAKDRYETQRELENKRVERAKEEAAKKERTAEQRTMHRVARAEERKRKAEDALRSKLREVEMAKKAVEAAQAGQPNDEFVLAASKAENDFKTEHANQLQRASVTSKARDGEQVENLREKREKEAKVMREAGEEVEGSGSAAHAAEDVLKRYRGGSGANAVDREVAASQLAASASQGKELPAPVVSLNATYRGSVPPPAPQPSAAGWRSGAYPPVWVDIELDHPRPVTALRVLLRQCEQSMETHHIVYAIPAGEEGEKDPESEANLVAEVAGVTRDGQQLNMRLTGSRDAPVAKVRVKTVVGGCPVEWGPIQVMGDAEWEAEHGGPPATHAAAAATADAARREVAAALANDPGLRPNVSSASAGGMDLRRDARLPDGAGLTLTDTGAVERTNASSNSTDEPDAGPSEPFAEAVKRAQMGVLLEMGEREEEMAARPASRASETANWLDAEYAVDDDVWLAQFLEGGRHHAVDHGPDAVMGSLEVQAALRVQDRKRRRRQEGREGKEREDPTATALLEVRSRLMEPDWEKDINKGSLAKTMTHDLTHQLTEMLAKIVTEEFTTELSPKLHASLVAPLKNGMSAYLGGALAHSVGEALPVALAQTVPTALNKVLPSFLIKKLTETATSTLTRALTHTLTPTLVHSLSYSPYEQYYCFYCKQQKKFCQYCHHSSKEIAYAVKHADFFAAYYSDYYAEYYTGSTSPKP